jgi:hypothetical protein
MTYDRLTAGVASVTQELTTASGVPVYLGGKSQETALCGSVTIALAASATTDGMDITITCKDAAGVRLAGPICLEVWISEDASGAGLTGDSYSGTVTASVGAVLTAYTAKKHFSVVTATSGIAVMTAVASANPADQYVCVKNPLTGRVHVSVASGTSWEGA